MKKIDVYLENGRKKTFASAVNWPGWSRSGLDEPSALQALSEYGARYADVLHSTELGFYAPENPSAFAVVEQLEGNATTDFGAPGMIPSRDSEPVDDELQRFQELLKACWQTFDTSARAAVGQELRKGPRGGGRDLEKIVNHVMEADLAYLRKIGSNFKKGEMINLKNEFRLTRQAILDALISAASGELPLYGPRGGLLWPPRYFVRRVAWHVLDHAWEIEDRMNGGS